MLAPSYRGSEPSPATKPPPKKYTKTGSPAVLRFAGVQTFRYKQSSLTPAEREFISPNTTACTGLGPKAFVLKTPFQLSNGWGAFQRSSPIGGFANGMPKYC